MGQAAIPIYTAIAAAGVNEANNRRTARKQDDELARGIRTQAETDRLAQERIGKGVDVLEGSSAEPIRANLQDKFIKQVLANRAHGVSGLGSAGAPSDEFREGSQAGAESATGFGKDIAGLLAGIDAPGVQRQREGFEAGDVGARLDELARRSKADDFLTRARVARIRPNPWLSIIASALGGASRGASANMSVPAQTSTVPNFNTGMGLDKFTFMQPPKFKMPGRA